MTFEVGDEIHHDGEQGRFRVTKIRKDGEVECYGGTGGCAGIKNTTGNASSRTFKPETCRIAKKKKVLRDPEA